MDRSPLQSQLQTIPAKPGVYLMKDKRGRVIYVGKAVNLRSRVRSYFHASADHPPKLRRMVAQVAGVDFIVTDSEVEALILECNLIKKHRPKYNVRLKDDKRYPYIKVTWQEDYPRIYITRRMEQDGARYFGPFTAVWAVRQTLDMLRKLFPYLTCKRKITGQDERPCLYYHIGRCAGPCIGAISKEEYRTMIEQVCLFLEGKADKIVADLRAQMESAAEALDFERAAVLRDQIQAVERVIERQKIVAMGGGDLDVIGLASEDGETCVQVFFVRQGKLIGREYFILVGTVVNGRETDKRMPFEKEREEILASFVKQFYHKAAYIPPVIIVPYEIEEAAVIQEWLAGKRGSEVVLRLPHPGNEEELVRMAAENAAETLASLRAQWMVDERKGVEALTDLQERLRLAEAPTRIEGYDISNIQGVAATGSMVVFVKGLPRKSDYRRFRIRTVAGADDYAMMKEVLRRRFERAIKGKGEEKEGAEAWTVLPDLVVVDGGKGQLNAALEVLEEYGLRDEVSVLGLAKGREEVFVPGRPEPLILPRDSEGLRLLQRVRDEAHRFAIGYHRKLRGKASLASILEEVPGIGPKRRRALLKHFGSIEAIREASVEELAAVEGMTRKAAESIKEYL
ncbi:MAG TPA: excinuclease ABC subunit UvrC [Anaerolineae bacterium]|nr:excinuclease ABC subunit UvrC [Anaerolineae bacterium]